MLSNNFDAVAEVYNLSRGYPKSVGEQVIQNLSGIFAGETKSRALEIGAGTGIFTQYVVDLVDSYVAIDVSRNMLNKMSRDLTDGKVICLVADASHLPFLENSFNVVVGSKVLRHIGDWRECLSEIKRVLRPGGVFIHVEEERLERTQAQVVRPKWYEILTKYGYRAHPNPGVENNETILSELKAQGFGECKKVTLASWQAASAPIFVINHLEQRGGSSEFGIPDDILDASLKELRAWATETFADPSEIEYKLKALGAVVAFL